MRRPRSVLLVGGILGLLFTVGGRASVASGACCNIQAFRYENFGAMFTHAKRAGASESGTHGRWFIVSLATAATFKDSSQDDEVGVKCDLEGVDQLKVVDPCSGWRYRWGAKGGIGGRAHARANALILSSAHAGASGAAQLSRNLSLFGEGHAIATHNASGTVSIGVGTDGGNLGLQWNGGSQASTSDNQTMPVGTVNGKSDKKFGPGPEVQVGIEITTEVYVKGDSFFNLAAAPHQVAARAHSRVTVVVPVTLALVCKGPGKFQITELDEPTDPDPPKIRTGDVTPGGIDWGPQSPVTPSPLPEKPAWPPDPAYGDPDGDGYWTP